MKEDLIADIWTLIIDHVPEKGRKTVAADFVNLLLDHGVKESSLLAAKGVDVHLDDAIQYVIGNDDNSDDLEDYE
jgi:hypothetical protein